MAPPLLFDVHVHYRASERLREEGIDVVHASDVGLANADDLTLLLCAAEAGRIVVTRNYQDFAPLARALTERGESYPGILFLSPATSQSDLSARVRTVRRWCRDAGEENPVENTVGWIHA